MVACWFLAGDRGTPRGALIPTSVPEWGTALSGQLVTSIRRPGRPVAAGSHSARPAFLFGNWYARAYLLVVAAVAVLVALVLWMGRENANLPGV